MTTILGFDTYDIRFPTSLTLDGSDAMNPSPDYSAAALVMRTDDPGGLAGHAIRVATGEHVSNRVVFKQLLQAGAIDVMQIDACRVAGVNENLANLLLAAKFGVPVCPHAGGVGLCEMVQHLSMFDYVALSGTMDGRRIEWIDHLHEHFVTPARISRGRYLAPSAPGGGAEFRPESLRDFAFPDGKNWRLAARA
jgi:L-fuconate dehydratase